MMRYILAMAALACFLAGPHGVAQVTSSDLPKTGAGQTPTVPKSSSVKEEKAVDAPAPKSQAAPQDEPIPTPAPPPVASGNAPTSQESTAGSQSASASQGAPPPRVGRTEPRSTGGKRVAAFWMMLPGRS